MKNHGCLLLMLIALLFAAANCAAEDPRPVVDDSRTAPDKAARAGLPTLYLVGDSTMNSGAPLRGWAQEIGAFFDPAKINVVNRAIGGRSSRTFITEGRWDKVLAELKPGDFVLVQFGHNDNGNYLDPAAKGRPSIRAEGEETAEAPKADGTKETIHTFGWYMRKYCTDGKAKGATVILCSMVPHKNWIKSHGEKDTFVKWTENAAKATGAGFIDLNAVIGSEYEKIGQEKINALYGDANTHANAEGAKFNARCVISALKGLKADPLEKYLGKDSEKVESAPMEKAGG